MPKPTPKHDVSALSELIGQEIEWRKCVASPEHFIDTFGVILDKAGGDPIPFKLWDCQRRAISTIHEHPQVIIGKTRQLGLSWAIIGYSLWVCMFTPNAHVYIRSIGIKEATEQHERFKLMYDHLPEWMRLRVRMGGKDLKRNDTVSQFSNGSSMHMLSSSKRAGHGASPTLTFWDEMARDTQAEKGWAAIKPAIANRGRVVIVSTSDGPSNLFARVWDAAQKRQNSFVCLFFAATEHPDYTPEFLERERRDYEAAGLIEEYKRAYPMTPEDMFTGSSRCPFDIELIHAMRRHVFSPRKGDIRYKDDDPKKLEFVEGKGHWEIWHPPEPDIAYTIGVDVAEGLKTGDFSVILVMDSRNRLCAMHRSKTAPEALAYFVEMGARFYNNALVGVENNTFPIVVQDLKHSYHNLYMREVRDKPWDEPTLKVGWRTTATTKRDSVTTIRREMADPIQPLSLPSTVVLDELLAFEEDSRGLYGAPKNAHDDTVIALGIALGIRSQQVRTTAGYVPPNPWPFEE